MMLGMWPLPDALWVAVKPPHHHDPVGGEQEPSPGTAGSKLRVLIVEDEFYIALDIEALLTSLGHISVGIAASCDQAIGIAEREQPDIILMDIRLAGPRDGIAAADEIFRRFGIRSVFVTANTDPHTRRRAAALDPIGFLEKPLTPQRLRAVLEPVNRQH